MVYYGICLYMDVSKNSGENPQNGWFIMENPIKIGWFGGPTPIFGNTKIVKPFSLGWSTERMWHIKMNWFHLYKKNAFWIWKFQQQKRVWNILNQMFFFLKYWTLFGVLWFWIWNTFAWNATRTFAQGTHCLATLRWCHSQHSKVQVHQNAIVIAMLQLFGKAWKKNDSFSFFF